MTSVAMKSVAERVLVVEDDAAVRAGLAESLGREGWQVLCAETCGRARELSDLCPKLVISDVRLPDGNGIELMRELKRRLPGISILLLTAFGNVSQAVEAMRDGAFDYLQKPVPFAQLREAARRVLKGDGPARVQDPRQGMIVGESPAIRDAVEKARQAARS